MEYIVQFDSLDALNTSVRTQTEAWAQELEKIKGKVQTLIDSSNMSGQAAENVRCYFENIHMTIIGLLSQLISLHNSNCLIYKSDYQSDVDKDLHAVICSDEINSYHTRLNTRKNKAVGIDDELRSAVNSIKDIFNISYADITETAGRYDSARKFLSDLDNQIEELENSHYGSDFTNTSQMIASLKAFIKEQTSATRSYKTDFTVEALASSKTFGELYDAYVAVSKECEEKAAALDEAIENEKDRVAALQEEYKEREKKAKVFKWIVTAVCIVGAIAATVATAGAASGLAAVAIAGSISAASSAVTAAAGNLADQYVEHGYDHSKYDWGALGKDVVVAGVAGFVTGAVGSGVSGAITSKLSSSAVGSAMLHSNSALVRIGTSAAIGSVSEVSSGVVSRGAATLITTGDIGRAWDEATDLGNIAVDVATGAAGGVMDNLASNKAKQDLVDKAASDYNASHNPLKDGQEAGLTNLKPTKNNGVDFKDSDYIYRTSNGDPIEIKIKSTGDRVKDYELAEKMLKEQGIDIDFKKLRKGSKREYVWHHLDDYNVTTNETTMQFIKVDAHEAIENHAGSAMQYHKANGQGYKKTAFTPEEIKFKPSEAISTTTDGIVETAVSNGKMSGDGYSIYRKILTTDKQVMDSKMSHIISKRPGVIGV